MQHGVVMVNMRPARRFGRQLHRDTREQLRETSCALSPSLVPLIQATKLDPQHGSLHLVEPAIHSQSLVFVVPALPVTPELSQTHCETSIVCRDSPCLAVSTKVLGA